jgi:hypothetical protein
MFASCASVQVTRVSESQNKEGVRYYRPHPYLWVSKDSSNNFISTVLWMPNTKEEYVIDMKSGLGSSEISFSLKDGWNLTDFNENRDSKILETIQALPGFMSSMTVLGSFFNKEVGVNLQQKTSNPLTPGLYAFSFDPSTGIINGLIPIIISGKK